MKGKKIIAALALLLAGGGGYYWTQHAHSAEAGVGAADESVATLVTVQVGRLRHATLHRYITGYGSIQPAPATESAPAATARVAAPAAAVVRRVLTVEGSVVRKGALLVELEDGVAQVALKNAQQTVERQQQLYAEDNTALKNLQEAEAQRDSAAAQLALLRVTAPLSGTIARLNVRPGEAVDLTTVVAEIVDLERLAVTVEIPAAEAAHLQLGDPLTIDGDRPVTARLNYVSSTVDPANDTLLVRALLPADSGWRAGALAPVRITTEVHADCLVAPAESVVVNADGEAVVALVKNDAAKQVPVQPGLREGNLIEIAGDGIKDGDAVVTVGAYGLPEQTRIRVVTAAVR